MGRLAVLVFVGVTMVDALTRPGFDPVRHWISHQSLGERGWLGTAALAVTGVLLAFAAARESGWPRRFVGLVAFALLGAAAFPIDPGLGWPPGVPAARTWVGSIHDGFGLLLVVGLIGTCVTIARRTRRFALPVATAAVVVLAFVGCGVLAALDFSGTWPEAPSGLLERVALYPGVAFVGLSARS